MHKINWLYLLNQYGFLKKDDVFFKNVLSIFVSQLIILFLSISTTAIIAHWLGPEGKGIIAMAMLLPATLVIILNGGIGISNVYFASSRKLDIPTLISNSMNITLLATGIGIGILTFLFTTEGLKKLIPGVPIWTMILAFICFPVSLMSNYLSNILQGLKRFLIYNIIGILQSIVTFIFILLLVAIFKVGLLGAILGYLFTAIITLIILILFFYLESGRFILKWNLSVIHKTLSYGMKGHIGNVLQYLNYRFDMFLVNYFLGAASVGIYSISVAVAELIWYFPNSVGFVIFPKAASTKPEIMNNFTPRVFRITLGINTLGAMGLILLGKTLIAFVYSPAFLPAYIPMITILPGVVLLGSAKVLTNEIAGRGYPHYNSINSGFSLVLTVILDIILIPKYHIIGAALASSISYSISFILAIGFYKIVSRKGKEIIEPKIINEGINVSTPTYKI